MREGGGRDRELVSSQQHARSSGSSSSRSRHTRSPSTLTVERSFLSAASTSSAAPRSTSAGWSPNCVWMTDSSASYASRVSLVRGRYSPAVSMSSTLMPPAAPWSGVGRGERSASVERARVGGVGGDNSQPSSRCSLQCPHPTTPARPHLAALGQVVSLAVLAAPRLLGLLLGQAGGALARHAVAHAPLHLAPQRFGRSIGLAARAGALLRREHQVGVLREWGRGGGQEATAGGEGAQAAAVGGGGGSGGGCRKTVDRRRRAASRPSAALLSPMGGGLGCHSACTGGPKGWQPLWPPGAAGRCSDALSMQCWDVSCTRRAQTAAGG